MNNYIIKNYIYRVNFIGRLNKSIGQTANLTKTFIFDSLKTREEIIKELYKTHEHIKILRITDCTKATAFNEVLP